MAKLKKGDILLHEVYKSTESGPRRVISFFQHLIWTAEPHANTVHASLYVEKEKTHIAAGYAKYEVLEMDASGLGFDHLPLKEKIHIFRPKNEALAAVSSQLAFRWYEGTHIGYSFTDCAKIVFPFHRPMSPELIKTLEAGLGDRPSFMCSEFVIACYSVALDSLGLNFQDYFNIPLNTSPAQLHAHLLKSTHFDYLGEILVNKKTPAVSEKYGMLFMDEEAAAPAPTYAP